MRDLGFTFFLRGTGQTTCTKLLTHIFDASFEGKMVICVTKIHAICIIKLILEWPATMTKKVKRDGLVPFKAIFEA